MSRRWRMSLRWQDTRWVCQSDNRSSRTGGTMRPSAAVILNKWVSHCRGKIDLATLVLLWAGPVWPSKIKRSVPVDKMNAVTTLEKFSFFQPVRALNYIRFTLKSYAKANAWTNCKKDAGDPVCKSLFTVCRATPTASETLHLLTYLKTNRWTETTFLTHSTFWQHCF